MEGRPHHNTVETRLEKCAPLCVHSLHSLCLLYVVSIELLILQPHEVVWSSDTGINRATLSCCWFLYMSQFHQDKVSFIASKDIVLQYYNEKFLMERTRDLVCMPLSTEEISQMAPKKTFPAVWSIVRIKGYDVRTQFHQTHVDVKEVYTLAWHHTKEIWQIHKVSC